MVPLYRHVLQTLLPVEVFNTVSPFYLYRRVSPRLPSTIQTRIDNAGR